MSAVADNIQTQSAVDEPPSPTAMTMYPSWETVE